MSTDKEKWKNAYAAVGELVLLYTGLDYQLNHIMIEVTHLAQSPMLEAVVATLDPRQKIEMLKARADHVTQPDWKKALKAHADRLERVEHGLSRSNSPEYQTGRTLSSRLPPPPSF